MATPDNSIFNNSFSRNPSVKLPTISTDLETVRTYQFEVNFEGFPAVTENDRDGGGVDVTVAAKQVGQISYGVESIPLDRLNDKVHYPGKPNYEPVEITFDNLLLKNSSEALWSSFKEVYSPMTGFAGQRLNNGKSYKGQRMTIVELNGANEPIASVELFGVYAEKVAFGERNYSTNEFNTITVTFRFDFVNYEKRRGIGNPGIHTGPQAVRPRTQST